SRRVHVRHAPGRDQIRPRTEVSRRAPQADVLLPPCKAGHQAAISTRHDDVGAHKRLRFFQIVSPMRQGTRGSLSTTGTLRCSGVRPATSNVSLVRIASLNLSRSLTVTTNELGPPITQSS